MAIDQDQKVLNLADETVKAVERFMKALEDLQSLEEERAGAGLTLTDFDAVFLTSSETKHVDGAALNAVLNTSVPAIWTFMTANFHDDNLQKVRP